MATRSPLARAAAAALLGAVLVAGPAGAQEKKTLTISMWGFNGDKLEAFLFKPFKEKHNVDIVLETGNAGDRLNKVKIRGGGVDLIYLSDVFAQVGLEDKLFEKIDTSRVPNVKDLYPAAQAPLGEGQGIAYTLGRYGVIYDSAKVNITSWADLWKPELKKRVTIPGFNTTAGPVTVLVAAQRKGIDAYANPDAAFASMTELKPNIVKSYNTGSEMVNLFSTGEIVAAAAQDFTFPQVKAAIPTAQVGRSERRRVRHVQHGQHRQGHQEQAARRGFHQFPPQPRGAEEPRHRRHGRARQHQGRAHPRAGRAAGPTAPPSSAASSGSTTPS